MPVANRGGEPAGRYAGDFFEFIYDMLSEHLEVVVGYPPKLKAIAETDKKTDEIDDEELSRLVWMGSVPDDPGYNIGESLEQLGGRLRESHT